MVLGLFTIAGIPSTIAVAEGVSRRDEAGREPQEQEAEQMRKFTLECFCDSNSGRAQRINGGRIILKGKKMYVEPKDSQQKVHGFEGFYIEYADQDRPKPLPLGMVSIIDSDPPTLNWIYVDKGTREVKYGNKSESKEHIVGPWSWDGGEEEGAGGVTLRGDEGAVAIETAEGWEIRWEDKHGRLGQVPAKDALRISLERKMLEPKESDKPISQRDPSYNVVKEESRTELSKSAYQEKHTTQGPGPQKAELKITGGDPKTKRKEPKLEILSTSTYRPYREK